MDTFAARSAPATAFGTAGDWHTAHITTAIHYPTRIGVAIRSSKGRDKHVLAGRNII